MCPRSAGETDGIAAKRLRCGIASEALRRNMPLSRGFPGTRVCDQYDVGAGVVVLFSSMFWKKGKDPHPQDKIQHLDFTTDPWPLYYKTPPCAFHRKNVRSKAVFGP